MVRRPCIPNPALRAPPVLSLSRFVPERAAASGLRRGLLHFLQDLLEFRLDLDAVSHVVDPPQSVCSAAIAPELLRQILRIARQELRQLLGIADTREHF